MEPERIELAGYYALKGGARLDGAALVQELRRRLPDYMVPAYLEQLPAIPMTVSNKADLRKLPKPTSARVTTDQAVVGARNDDERFLAGTLAEVLKFEAVSVEDHFFDDLGANSLLMARLCARIRTRKGWSTTSMRDIYLNPTVARLAAHLSAPHAKAAVATEPLLVHKASNLAYWATGAGQLLFFLVYSDLSLWAINDGLQWVYDALDGQGGCLQGVLSPRRPGSGIR